MNKFLRRMFYWVMALWLIGYIAVCFFYFELLNPISTLLEIPEMTNSERGEVMIIIFLVLFFGCIAIGGTWELFDSSESYLADSGDSLGSIHTSDHKCDPDDALDTVVKVGAGVLIGSLLD
jgi:hypothetical protein